MFLFLAILPICFAGGFRKAARYSKVTKLQAVIQAVTKRGTEAEKKKPDTIEIPADSLAQPEREEGEDQFSPERAEAEPRNQCPCLSPLTELNITEEEVCQNVKNNSPSCWDLRSVY